MGTGIFPYVFLIFTIHLGESIPYTDPMKKPNKPGTTRHLWAFVGSFTYLQRPNNGMVQKMLGLDFWISRELG